MIGKTLFSAKILSFKSVLVESKTMTAPQKQAYCALIREKHGRCTSCTLSRKAGKKEKKRIHFMRSLLRRLKEKPLSKKLHVAKNGK